MPDDTLISLTIAARAAGSAHNAAVAAWAGAVANFVVAAVALASPWLISHIARRDSKAASEEIVTECIAIGRGLAAALDRFGRRAFADAAAINEERWTDAENGPLLWYLHDVRVSTRHGRMLLQSAEKVAAATRVTRLAHSATEFLRANLAQADELIRDTGPFVGKAPSDRVEMSARLWLAWQKAEEQRDEIQSALEYLQRGSFPGLAVDSPDDDEALR